MAGGVIPDHHELSPQGRPPAGYTLQEVAGRLAVARAVLPDQALPVAEVIRPVPIEPLGEPRRGAHPPGSLPLRAPGVAIVEVLVEVRLVDVDQRHLVATDAGEQLFEPGDVLGPLAGLGLAQDLLDLLPAQPGGEQ